MNTLKGLIVATIVGGLFMYIGYQFLAAVDYVQRQDAKWAQVVSGK